MCSEVIHTVGGRALTFACLLVLFSGPARALASERQHDHPAGSTVPEAVELDPRTAAVAGRLWKDLVCLCDRCERLALAACPCPDAAAERKNVVELLRGKDLSSPAASEAAAYQAAVQSYVARSGRQVLASARSKGISADVATWIGSVAVVIAACGAFVAIELRRRRRTASRPRVGRR